jgi:hypothetical protein
MSVSGRKGRIRDSRRYRKFLQGSDEDPLGGVANLFDVAMVFAVALILALFQALQVPELLSSPDEVTLVKNPGKPDMEIVRKRGIKLETFRMTREAMQGQGERLGICYRLANGEVVYVPESLAAGDGPSGKEPPAQDR